MAPVPVAAAAVVAGVAWHMGQGAMGRCRAPAPVRGAAQAVAVPLDDAGLDEIDDADMNQDDEIIVQGGSPLVSSSGDDESAFSSSATEIDACLEQWVTTDVAKRLMEFLERELPRQ